MTTTPDIAALVTQVGAHVYSGVVGSDGHYRESFTGPGLTEILGGEIPDDADAATAWDDAVHPDDREGYFAAGSENESMVRLEYRLVGYDGVTRWVLDQMWVREVLPDGSKLVDGIVSDITELREHRSRATTTAARLDAAVAVSPAAMILMDRDARVQLWNPAAERLFGWTADEALGRVAPHVPEDRHPAFLQLLSRMAAGEELVDHEEVRSGRDGRPLDVSISSALVRNDDGEVVGFMGLVTDVTARKDAENRLRQLAHSDPLTGLANRVLITQRIEEAVGQLRNATSGVALLLLDLDGFKSVNDSFGHAVGDELLLSVARRLTACLRGRDVAARLGGDEFALLLEGVDPAEAIAIAERLLLSLAEPFTLRRAEVVVTASIGIVHAHEGQHTEDLLRDADVAMYKAKGDGKNRIVIFEPMMQERVAARMRLESELRIAVVEEQFELHYQPFVNLDTSKVVGVEALIRWNHPTRGLLLPQEFIAVAEDTGLIVQLGRWIIHRACEQAAQWQPIDPGELLRVAVNLSPRQLHDPQLIETTSRALAAAGLPPASLTIEITENLLLGDTVLAGAQLARLRDLGVQIAVDDFGTGYSSLAYLRRYPVDILKIDRSFVSPVNDGPRQRALVQSIIDLAGALDVDTVAEGVEAVEQATALSGLGCHVAQGYYFARPLPADAVLGMLSSPLIGLPAQAGADMVEGR